LPSGQPVKSDYKAEDNRPWMSDVQFAQVKERMINGDKEAFDKAKKAFKMKKAFREELEKI
jgi:hypothetical protein